MRVRVACVAMLLSTSLVVLAGNGNDSNRDTIPNESDNCIHVDKSGYLVAAYDEAVEFVGRASTPSLISNG